MLTLLLIHFLLIIISFGLYTYHIIKGDVPKDHWAAALVILCPVLNVIYIYNELRKLFFPQFVLWEYVLPVLKALGVIISGLILLIIITWINPLIPLWLRFSIAGIAISIFFIILIRHFKA